MSLTPHRPSPIAARLAGNRLGAPSVAGFVLSAAAPVTVVAGIIPTGYATTGILGIPLAIAVTGVVLVLFAVGFNAMSCRISNAGVFYAYIAQGLGRPPGVAAAVVAMLAYNLLQVGLYGVFGAAVIPLLNPRFGIDMPWWGWALAAWSLVAVLGIERAELNGRILAVLMGMEILFILILDLSHITNPAGGVISTAAFEPPALLVPGVGAVFVIAITSFVGFEQSAIYAGQSRDPLRTAPRTTYLCLCLITVLYSVSAWAMTVTTGPDQIRAVAAANGGETLFVMAAANLGPAWSTIGHVLFTTSVFAAMISYHNTVGRYSFALGREGVLPAVFGTATRYGAPKWGSLAQTLIGAAVIAGYALTGLDPVVHLFFWCSAIGGFGVLLLLTATAMAIIGYHLRHHTLTLWSGMIAPSLSLVALAFIVEPATRQFATLLGVPSASPLRWIFPVAYLAAAAVGLIWAAVLRRAQPDTYRTIGLGANSAIGRVHSAQDDHATQDLGTLR